MTIALPNSAKIGRVWTTPRLTKQLFGNYCAVAAVSGIAMGNFRERAANNSRGTSLSAARPLKGRHHHEQRGARARSLVTMPKTEDKEQTIDDVTAQKLEEYAAIWVQRLNQLIDDELAAC